MTLLPINRVLRAGPGRREIHLDSDPFDPSNPPAGCFWVRNHLTLIYSGVDLRRVERGQREERAIDLGCLAIGQVERFFSGSAGFQSASPLKFPHPKPGDWIFYNGPHADFGLLDPAKNVWIPVAGPDPLLLTAGIGAEAQFGVEQALQPEEYESSRSGFPDRHVAQPLSAVIRNFGISHAIVLGQGMLGNLAAQFLKLRGASVTVVENSPKRLEFSKYLGLTQKIDTHNLDWRERIRKWNPDGVELIVDACGYPQALSDVLPFLRAGGKVCLLGPWRTGYRQSELSLSEPRPSGSDRTATDATLTLPSPLERERGCKKQGASVARPFGSAHSATSLPPDAPLRSRLGQIGGEVYGPFPSFGETPEHRPPVEAWIKLIHGKKIGVDRLLTDRVPAAESPLAVKRLSAGVKSICGVVIDWTA